MKTSADVTSLTSVPNTPAKRTNSLGRAKSDCHTCSEKSRSCDRQRPRCTTCEHHNVLCGGYILPLFWQSNVSLRSRASRSTSPVGGSVQIQHGLDSRLGQSLGGTRSTIVSPQIRQYKFKAGRPKKRRKPPLDGPNKRTAVSSNTGGLKTTPVICKKHKDQTGANDDKVYEESPTQAIDSGKQRLANQASLSGKDHDARTKACETSTLHMTTERPSSITGTVPPETHINGDQDGLSASNCDLCTVPAEEQSTFQRSRRESQAPEISVQFANSGFALSQGIRHSDYRDKYRGILDRCM